MKDKVVFMRQLATMVGAGLPLTRELRVMEQQISNPMFKRVITQVKSSVEAGKVLRSLLEIQMRCLTMLQLT